MTAATTANLDAIRASIIDAHRDYPEALPHLATGQVTAMIIYVSPAGLGARPYITTRYLIDTPAGQACDTPRVTHMRPARTTGDLHTALRRQASRTGVPTRVYRGQATPTNEITL